MKSRLTIGLVLAAMTAGGASASPPPIVLLFDKHCSGCSDTVLRSRRQLGTATLSVLERHDESYFVRERWRANYGAHDGPKECLADLKTPVGLYYTKVIHRKNVGRGYGYTSILLDYPNADDGISVAAPNLASRCAGAGAYIAIHGGWSGTTLGCIRLLDEVAPRDGIHQHSIRKLANLIRSLPKPTVPVLSVDEANPGCHPAVGAQVSPACSQALSYILDRPTRPARSLVLRYLEAPDPKSPQLEPTAVVALADAWATSEAQICGLSGKEPCLARYLLDGDAATMWCDLADAGSAPKWLAVRLIRPGPIRRVVLRNGSWQKERAQLYGRVLELEIRFGGQVATCTAAADDSNELSCPLTLDGATGDSLLLRLRRSKPGTIFPGACITDLMLYADG